MSLSTGVLPDKASQGYCSLQDRWSISSPKLLPYLNSVYIS